MLALLSTVRPTMAPSSTVKVCAPFMWTQPFSVVPSKRSIQPIARLRSGRSRRAAVVVGLRQRERDDRVAGLRGVLAAAAGGNRDVLPAVDHVDARRRIAAGRQLVLPQHPARVLLEGADLLVGGGRDEDHAAGRRDRAAEVHRAGVADPFATSCGYSPSGTFQRMSPLTRSMAFSVPHGGAIAGTPCGSRNSG